MLCARVAYCGMYVCMCVRVRVVVCAYVWFMLESDRNDNYQTRHQDVQGEIRLNYHVTPFVAVETEDSGYRADVTSLLCHLCGGHRRTPVTVTRDESTIQ